MAHGVAKEAREAWPEDEDLLYLPSSQHLSLMSVGYREALADLIWIRAVIFAGSALGRENYDWVRSYLRVVNELVPTFRRPYAWGGVVVIYNGKAIGGDMVRTAIEIYREGLARFPEDHEMLFALAMILSRDVTEEAGFSAEEVNEAKREATELVRRAAAFGAPPLVRQLAATLVTQGSVDELTIQFLESQLLATEDPDYQRVLRQKLSEIVGERRFEHVVELRRSFYAERNAAYPYLDDVVYAIVRDEAARAPAEDDAGRDD